MLINLFRKIVLPVVFLFYVAACSADKKEEEKLVNYFETEATTPELLMTVEETGDHFFSRLSMLVPDSQQRLYLVDGGSSTIYHYDAEGRFIGTIGGPGRGPGEFEQVGYVSLDDRDRLFVLDFSGFQFNVLEEAGPAEWEFQNRFSVYAWGDSDFPTRMPGAFGLMPGGELVVVHVNNFSMNPNDEDVPPITVRVYSSEGEPVRESVMEARGESVLMVSMGEQTMVFPQPYGYTNISAIDADGVLYQNWSEDTAIRVLDTKQENARTDTAGVIPAVPKKITPEMVAEAVENINEAARRDARDGIPDHAPFFRYMIADDEGRVWLALYEQARFSSSHRFVVFNAESGSVEQVVEFEHPLHITRIRDGRIYGIASDEDGLQRGEVYAVAR